MHESDRPPFFTISGSLADFRALFALIRGEDADTTAALKRLDTSVKRVEGLGAEPTESPTTKE